MFQNVFFTPPVAPLANTDEIHYWDNRPFVKDWPAVQQQPTKDSDIKRTIKKKPKRVRTAFTTSQLRMLEKCYSKHSYVDKDTRQELSNSLKIDEKIIKVWFQNRRAKDKKYLSDSGDSIESVSVNSDSDTHMEKHKPQTESTNRVDGCFYESPSEVASKYPMATPNSVESNPVIESPFQNLQLQNEYQTVDNNAQFLPPCYQFSSFYNQGTSNNMSRPFVNDFNVYQTQYYPDVPGYHANGEAHHCYEGDSSFYYLGHSQ